MIFFFLLIEILTCFQHSKTMAVQQLVTRQTNVTGICSILLQNLTNENAIINCNEQPIPTAQQFRSNVNEMNKLLNHWRKKTTFPLNSITEKITVRC